MKNHRAETDMGTGGVSSSKLWCCLHSAKEWKYFNKSQCHNASKNNIFLLGRSIAYNYARSATEWCVSINVWRDRATDRRITNCFPNGGKLRSFEANAGGKIGGGTAIHQCQSPSSHLTNSTNIMETVNGRTD